MNQYILVQPKDNTIFNSSSAKEAGKKAFILLVKKILGGNGSQWGKSTKLIYKFSSNKIFT